MAYGPVGPAGGAGPRPSAPSSPAVVDVARKKEPEELIEHTDLDEPRRPNLVSFPCEQREMTAWCRPTSRSCGTLPRRGSGDWRPVCAVPLSAARACRVGVWRCPAAIREGVRSSKSDAIWSERTDHLHLPDADDRRRAGSLCLVEPDELEAWWCGSSASSVACWRPPFGRTRAPRALIRARCSGKRTPRLLAAAASRPRSLLEWPALQPVPDHLGDSIASSAYVFDLPRVDGVAARFFTRVICRSSRPETVSARPRFSPRRLAVFDYVATILYEVADTPQRRPPSRRALGFAPNPRPFGPSLLGQERSCLEPYLARGPG